MAYYLRKEEKGIYLQMYESHQDKERKQPRFKSVMAFGYVQDLISDEIPDPVAYYTDFVAKKNQERAAAFSEETRPRAFAAPLEYHLGHFLPILFQKNSMSGKSLTSSQLKCAFRSVYII